MNVIIPMAGMGKRMRPHTLVTPKPLLKIAGKSIVHRIVEGLEASTGKRIEEIHFVVGNFGEEVEESLFAIAKSIDAVGHIHYQEEALGTAHAVYCAANGMNSEVIVAFADTMFIGNFDISANDEAIIWTKEVQNPENYGVVITDKNSTITSFAEKPKQFVSNKAIVGIYYFREGELLQMELKRLIDGKHLVNGEYQLTDALQSLMNLKVRFTCKTIDKWLDCGNKEEFLESAKQILNEEFLKSSLDWAGCKIIDPVYIGKNVKLIESEVGPNVIVEDNVVISNTVIRNSVVGCDTVIDKSEIERSIVGSNTHIIKAKGIFNIGDFNTYEGK